MQCEKFCEVETPPWALRSKTIDITNKDYLRFDNPKWLDTYDRSVWYNAIEELKSSIKEDSSPGVPFALMAQTNGQVFRILGRDFNDAVLDRIESLLSYTLEEIKSMSSLERVDKNLVDPVRCFVKSEPHKMEKVKEGRMRLIASVSLVDKMIEMMLHRTLHKLEIMNWRTLPSKPGIGFCKEMNEDVYDYVMEKQKETPMCYTDVSGWDWSVKAYMIEDCAIGVSRLCNNPSSVWQHLVHAEAIKEANTVYQFSDGTMVRLKYEGIVNSGKYKTSRGNSWMRVYLGHLVGAKHICAAGDDSVESYVSDAISKYAALGFKIKDYQRVEDGFEFCSRWYQKDASFPLNGNKALMNLLHSRIETSEQFDMSLLQFTDLMEEHPDFPTYTNLLEAIGFMGLEGRWEPKQILFKDGSDSTKPTTPTSQQKETSTKRKTGSRSTAPNGGVETSSSSANDAYRNC